MLELNNVIRKTGEEAFFSIVVGLGCAAGAIVGSLFENVGLSVGLGVAFGAAIASMILHEYRRERPPESEESTDT